MKNPSPQIRILVIFLVYPKLSLILTLKIEFLMIRSIWKEFLAKLPVHFGNSVTVRTAKSKISSKCVLHFLGYSKLKSYIIKTQNYKINDFLLLFVSIVVESNKFSGLLYFTSSTTHQRWVEVQFGRYQINVLQEWSMVKNLSCVSCAAWNNSP